MIHEERTRLMARLAIYESTKGRKELQITKFAPGDYVSLQIIWSVLCGTIAFVILFALYAFYNVEILMEQLFSTDIIYFARNVLIIYVVFMGIYISLCYAYLSYRYLRYKKRVQGYLMKLRDLYKMQPNTQE